VFLYVKVGDAAAVSGPTELERRNPALSETPLRWDDISQELFAGRMVIPGLRDVVDMNELLGFLELEVIVEESEAEEIVDAVGDEHVSDCRADEVFQVLTLIGFIDIMDV